MDKLNYIKLGGFIETTTIILNAPIYDGVINGVIDVVFDFIVKGFTDEELDVVVSMLAERVDDIENVDSKVRLLRFIQEHRKGDEDGSEIVL